MKNEMEKEVLLAMSGELSPANQAKLEDRIRKSEPATTYRLEAERLMADAREHLMDADPNPDTITCILNQASEMRRGLVIVFPQTVVRSIAGAAALALIVASWFALTPTTPAPDPVSNLHAIVAMVSEQDALLQGNGDMAERERMLTLARQLLIMEGFTEETNSAEEEALLFEAPEPTTLRLRNTSASPQEIYG